MAKLSANSGDPDQMLCSVGLIWVCTVCQLRFYGSPNHNGLTPNMQYYTPGFGGCDIYFLEKYNKFFIFHCKDSNQGPVVQSIISLTSLLRVISLTVLADSIYNILIFFAEKM